jgi:two-component system, OmpR family, copper resistance phosphate regulon response regulator CusR
MEFYSNTKILIIEDEPKVQALIRQGLEEIGFIADAADNGLTGLEKAETGEFDVIIIDLLLPQIHGLDICRQIRKKYPKVKILMLTALGTLDDKLRGFESGADDYLVKPFDFPELVARIKSLLKRNQDIQGQEILQIADLSMNITGKTVTRAGKNIELTAKEFHLLEYLLRNQGRVVSKAEIADKIWDISFETGTNVIEVYVNFLRKKIEKGFDKKLIYTLIGMGYVIKDV